MELIFSWLADIFWALVVNLGFDRREQDVPCVDFGDAGFKDDDSATQT
jgi:hypothetical protein